MSCRDKITKSTGCKFCLIALPCHCSLKLDHISIPNRIINCVNNDKLTRSFSVNLAVLHNFTIFNINCWLLYINSGIHCKCLEK